MLFYHFQTDAVSAIIVVDGKTVETIDLSGVTEPYQFRLEGSVPAVIAVEKGRIRYLEAECPDHLCVNAGWLSKAGEVAACLPGRSYLVLKGEGEADFDAVTG